MNEIIETFGIFIIGIVIGVFLSATYYYVFSKDNHSTSDFRKTIFNHKKRVYKI